MNQNIWIVDDDDAIRFIMTDSIQQWGYQTQSYSSANEAITVLAQLSEPPALIISDVRMPGIDGMEFLEKSLQKFPDLPFIITTAHADLNTTVQAYQQGVFDYLPKPFDLDELQHLIAQVMRQKNNPLKKQAATKNIDQEMIGSSPSMQQLYRSIGKLAKTSVNVLISGETGTGKELIAKALHKHSPANQGNFVAINMAAIPAELAEAELFGYEKGAFTGANQTKKGRFAQADGGTLFLDEIGDMPLALQAKLLRATAEGGYYPIGSQQLQKSNARIIAASHRNISQLVEQQLFREDLYHRLNVIHLELPPLRKRGQDIIDLLDFHLKKAASTHQLPHKKIAPSAQQFLLNYYWPGNIRQLENLCQQLTIMSPVDIINVEDLPTLPQPSTQSNHANQKKTPDTTPTSNSEKNWQQQLAKEVLQSLTHHETELYQHYQSQLDDVLIQTTLKFCDYHKQNAASILGIGRNTFSRKLQKK